MAKNKTNSLKQVYGIPTLDALFKYVLSENSVRPSFFHAFLPNITITSSDCLDEHMHPVQDFQVLRHFLHNKLTKKRVRDLRKDDTTIEVYVGNKTVHYNKSATKLFTNFLQHFEEIARAFPAPMYNGSMDFLCRLDNGEIALVEMQVLPQDFWDRRALALAALTFGGQLRRGSDWGQIRRVIGLNILGGGPDDRGHWMDTPDQYMRYYQFVEQLQKENPPRILDGIELIQYSLKNAPTEVDSQEKQDWLLFFKQAHMMTEEDVRKQVKTPAVLQAFDLAKIQNMPANVRDRYKEDELKYGRFSIHIRGLMEIEKKESEAKIKKIEAEKKMQEQQFIHYLQEKGESLSSIQKVTRLSKKEIKEILGRKTI